MRFKKTSSLKNGLEFLVFLLAFFPLFFVTVWAQSVSIRLKVVTEQANVRLKPDIGSIIIYQLPQGTIVDSSEKEGEWYRVRLVQDEGDTVSGYVHESLVIEIEKPPQEREAGEKKIERKEVSKVEREELEQIQPSPVTPASLKASFSRFNLFLSGGGNFISGGDLNEGSQGLADYYSDILGIQGKGDIKPLNLSYIFGAEASFSLSNVFSVGIGADYFLRERESRVEFQSSSSTDSLTTRPKIKAIPMRVVIYCYPVHFFYIKTGLEYFFTECSYFYRIKEDNIFKDWTGEAKARDVGIVGGFGFVQEVVPHLDFFMEATGRYARINNFEGKTDYKDSTGLTYTEEGMLYIFKHQISEEESCSLLFIRDKKPTEAGVSDVHNAMIDLSGFSIKAGIRIRF